MKNKSIRKQSSYIPVLIMSLLMNVSGAAGKIVAERQANLVRERG